MGSFFKRIGAILTYYDTEPMEILQGVIWLFVYPILHIIDHGFDLLLIPSILIGIAMIKATCSFSLYVRKTIAFAAFLFSILVVTFSFIYQDLPYSTMHWVWVLIAINSIINLKIITNRYYILENGRNR